MKVRVKDLCDEPPISKIPLDELIQLWKTYRTPAPASVQTLKGVLEQFTKFTGCYCLDDIKRKHFIEWRDDLMERGRKPATWNNYLRHMRMLLRFAKSEGWKSLAVLSGVKTLPANAAIPKKTISRENLTTVIDWLEYGQSQNINPGWFWVNSIKFLYFTGMRRRQFIGLTWSDVDTERMQIRLIAEHSKTKRSWSIPLHPALIPVLEEQKDRLAKKLKRPVRRDDQLFNCNLWYSHSSGDEAMTEEQVTSAFGRIYKHTGIRISAHRFRHTFATNLANQNGGNVNMKNVQQILGHTNILTTMGYVQPDLNVMRDLMGGLDNDL